MRGGKSKPSMTAEEARSIWRYDPEEGAFYWLVNPGRGRKPGDRAGTFDGRYRTMVWKGREMYAHHIAWLMIYGVWPDGVVDHKDGCKTNNKIGNLRITTFAGNIRNTPVRRTNKLGIKGVSQRGNRFVAQIWVDYQGRFLGSFGTAEEAKAAYDRAAAGLHGEQARL